MIIRMEAHLKLQLVLVAYRNRWHNIIIRDEEAARRRKVGKIVLSSASTIITARATAVLYIQDTVQKGETRDYTRVKRMRSGISSRIFVKNMSLFL